MPLRRRSTAKTLLAVYERMLQIMQHCMAGCASVCMCVYVCVQGTCAGGSISNGGSCKRHKRVWCREHASFAFGMTLEGVKRSFLYGASCCSLLALLLLGQPFGKYMLLWPCVIMRTSGPSRMGSNRAPPATPHPSPPKSRILMREDRLAGFMARLQAVWML